MTDVTDPSGAGRRVVLRWIVREGDPTSIGEIVRAAGADARAIDDGRVFVGRRRVLGGDEPVAVGDEVRIAAERDVRVSADVRILHRSPGWLALDKPAGMPTIPDHGGASGSLLATAARISKMQASAIHPTSRLDRDVSGVVVFALTERARELAKRAREESRYERRYIAIANAAPDPPEGLWAFPIGRAKDPRHRMVNGKNATHAETLYRTIARAGPFALLALAPLTGRTHQLRVHASHAGAALLGDRVYGRGSRLTLPSGQVCEVGQIALFAARIRLEGLFEVSSSERKILDLWTTLGGDAGAWDIAVSCVLGRPLP